jgi:hypothetical protein
LSLLALAQAQTFGGNYSTISNTTSSDCPGEGGAHIIVARASVEPLGYGIIGAVKDSVIAQSSASNAEYVVYPATLTDYFNSESAGVLGMRSLVEAYLAKDCAGNAPLVLMGYSQGAQVVADYLSGQNVAQFPYNASLSDPPAPEVFSRIAAVITMGDPSINITDNAAHVGNSTQPGLFERAANSSMVLSGIADKTQAYCDALDPYCASAGTFEFISVHIGYVGEYGQDAVEFVTKKIEQYYSGSMDGGSGATTPTNGTGGGNGAMTPTQSGSQQPAYTGAAAGMRAESVAAAVMAMGIAFACAL